jgi:hypothetical protein
MSDLAVAYARQVADDLPPRQAQALHYLAGLADTAHSVTISRAELSRCTGIPLKSIKGIFEGLIAKGLLTCERQSTDCYGYTANRYTFTELARRYPVEVRYGDGLTYHVVRVPGGTILTHEVAGPHRKIS